MKFRIEIERQGSTTVKMGFNQALAQAHNGRVQPITQPEPLPSGFANGSRNEIFRFQSPISLEAARTHSGHSFLSQPLLKNLKGIRLCVEPDTLILPRAGISQAFRLQLRRDWVRTRLRRIRSWVKAVSVVRPTHVSELKPNNVRKAPGKNSAACPEPKSRLGPISVASQSCNIFTTVNKRTACQSILRNFGN